MSELEKSLAPVLVCFAGVAVLARVSPREREALKLAASGCSNKEIAEIMRTTVGTVKGYLHRAFDKLGLEGGRESLK